MSAPLVVVEAAPPGAVAEAVRRCLHAVDADAVLGDAARVLVKPNLGFDLPHPGAVTSAGVLRAVVEALVEGGRQVVIVEADQVLVDIEVPARAAGVFDLVAEHPAVSWLNLSRLPTRVHRPARPRVLSTVDLPAVIGTAPLVTLPVLKTHAKTVMSGALKNQWALLPVDRWRRHPVLPDALFDLWQVAPPALCLMDATIGMEGDGPKSGSPRRVDALLASRSAPAIDAAACALMGIDPAEVAHLALHDPQALHPALQGSLPAVAPFERASHNLVSRIEEGMHEWPGGRLVLDTPLFPVACAGARLWYRIWHLRQGGGSAP